MSIQVKICGLKSEDAIQAVIDNKADYAGFIYFARSPRHLELSRAAALKKLLPASIKAASVLVDPDDALLKQVSEILQPDFFQLHGKETPERVQEIRKAFAKISIIKAISIKTGDDVAQAKRYESVADMLMFDAKPPDLPGMLPGGNALSFDWALLKGREFSRPWMLSGGLTPDNVHDAIAQSGAKIVDVSSGVESAPGIKDPALIKAFIEAARS